MRASLCTLEGLIAPGARHRPLAATRARPGGVYALKPIGRSPAFYKKEEKQSSRRPLATVANLFGGGEAKAKIGQLEYELETERAHSSALGLKLREAEAELARVSESLELYKGRCKEQDKDIFKLERQLEEVEKGFATGMAVAKRQIKMLEEKLEKANDECLF